MSNTMTAHTHTPTPWKRMNNGMIAAQDESAVAGTWHNAQGGPDNSAHIVRCVNAHDALVEACRLQLAVIDGTNTTPASDATRALRAALAKAAA